MFENFKKKIFKKKILIIFLLLLIIGSGIFFRVVNFQADPIHTDYLDNLDEGLYSYASRNFYLYGKWQTDGLNYWLIMPVYPPLQLLGLKLFGLRNYAFRLINYVSFFLTAILLFFFLRKKVGNKVAIISLSLLLLNFFYIFFNRSALPEATMLFFMLLAFVIWFYTLTLKKNRFLYGFLTAITSLVMFFTKQSSASFLGVILTSLFIMFYYEKKKYGNKILKKYLNIFLGLLLGFIIFLGLYILIFYLPNKELWWHNYNLTIGVNRPRSAILNLNYLFGEISGFLLGPQWLYLPILTLGLCLYLLLIFLKLKTTGRLFNLEHNSGKIELLVFAWLLLFFINYILMPAKYSRFFMPVILPMIILFSFHFEKNNLLIYKQYIYRKFELFLWLLLITEAGFNIFMNYKYFVNNAKYSYLQSMKRLEQITKKEVLVNYPATWIMNSDSKNISTYGVELNDKAFADYYNKYGWPKYMAILNNQIKDYRQNTPVFFSGLDCALVISDYKICKLK